MADLYITRAQPNPRGRDRAVRATVQNAKLNEEWIEFRAVNARDLINDEIVHETYDTRCALTGSESIYKFSSVKVSAGQFVRVHTGSGTSGWTGNTYHAYMGYGWFKWNNECGDVVRLSYSGTTIDHARYKRNPPEGELQRKSGTNELA